MALVAFDFMGIDMGRMHEVCVVVLIQSVCFPMTFKTVFSWDFSISDNCVAVAFVTCETTIKDDRVVIF